MPRRRTYTYLIETYGAPRVEGAPVTHTGATIAYFPFPWRTPLGRAEAAWMADLLKRLFVPPAETVSVFLTPVGRNAIGDTSETAALVGRLRAAASAVAEENHIVCGYRFSPCDFETECLQQMWNFDHSLFIAFDPPSPAGLRSCAEAVTAYLRARCHVDTRSASSQPWCDFDEAVYRVLRRIGLGKYVPGPPSVAGHGPEPREQPWGILWRLIADEVGVAYVRVDDERLAFEIASKGVRPEAFAGAFEQSRERCGIDAIRVRSELELR